MARQSAWRHGASPKLRPNVHSLIIDEVSALIELSPELHPALRKQVVRRAEHDLDYEQHNLGTEA